MDSLIDDPSGDRQITGVHGQITGVDNTPLRVTPDTQRDAQIVRGITPPRLIRPPVEVEDVESDDKDDEEERNNNDAPQTNVGSDVEQDESDADAPQLGRGRRVQTPPAYYQADHTNIRYAYLDEADVIHTCFQGATLVKSCFKAVLDFAPYPAPWKHVCMTSASSG